MSAVTASALLILATLGALLTGGTLLEPKSTIYLYMPDAVGLVAGAPVRVDGIGVGKVESVTLSGSREPTRVVKVTMTVDRERLRSVPDDSTAEASAETFVGDKFVDITSGVSATRVRPGGEITYKATPDMLKRLDVEQFDHRLRVIDALVTEIEQGKTPLGQFVQGDEMYRSLLKRTAEIEAGIHAASNVTGALGSALNTDTLYRQIADPLNELDQNLAKIQSGQGPLGQFLHDDAQYAQLRDSLNGLRTTLGQFRSDEFLSSDRQYAEWTSAVQTVIHQVDGFAASPMLATTAVYDNLNGIAKELESELKDFRENPKKYLRLKMF